MNTLQSLRNAPWLARLALLWFAMTLGVAAASPLLQPQPTSAICTGAGMLQVVLADDGTAPTTSDSGDGQFCPLCVVGGALEPVVVSTVAHPLALRHTLPGMAVVNVLVLTAAPPPARGPPTA